MSTPTDSDWLQLWAGGQATRGAPTSVKTDSDTHAHHLKSTPAPVPAIPEFEIVEELGRGGMGVVYKAHQPKLNRLVALKVIGAGAMARAVDLARFESEAKAVAKLHHRHIVQIHEMGQFEGLHYLTLEYVSGGTLQNFLRGQPQPPAAAARFMRFVADAVAYAHDQGIIHRDLKPLNILLEPDHESSSQQGRDARFDGPPRQEGIDAKTSLANLYPKISDFGLAKWLNHDSQHTNSGEVIGTPCYMSPEQASGQSKHIGPSADIYSLGAILYELLTGRPPFHGVTPIDTVVQVMSVDPVSPRVLVAGIPKDLETITLKCLEKEQHRRYASAADLSADLQRFLEGQPIQARPLRRVERVWRWCKRKPAEATLLAFVLMLLTVAFFTSLWWFQERAARAEDELVLAQWQFETQQKALLALEAEYQSALFHKAQAEATKSWALWVKAMEAISNAREQLQHFEAEPAQRERVNALYQLIQAQEQKAAVFDRDQRMADLLSRIMATRSDYGKNRTRPSKTNDKYAAAFADYGIPILSLPAEEAGRLIRASGIRKALLNALDDWTLIRYEEVSASPERWRVLTAVAMAADNDAIRNRIRKAMDQRDVKTLREMALDPKVETWNERTLYLLGRLLWLEDQPEAALKVILKGYYQQPGDFHINNLLIRVYKEIKPVPWDQVLRHATVALAVRRQSSTWQSMGMALQQVGLWEEARNAYLNAIEQESDNPHAHYLLGSLLLDANCSLEAMSYLQSCLKMDPQHLGARLFLTRACRRLGRWEEAREQVLEGLHHYPQSRLLREERLRLDQLLSLTPGSTPTAAHAVVKDPEAMLLLAEWLQGREQSAQALSLFAEVFKAMPERWNTIAQELRIAALACAARVGFADEAIAEERRLDARLCLRAWLELEHRRLLRGAASPNAAKDIRDHLLQWLNLEDLRWLRDVDGTSLSASEREYWQGFWKTWRDWLRRL